VSNLRVPLAKVLAGAPVFTDGDWIESKDQDPNGEVRLIQLADIGDGTYLSKSSRFLTTSTAQRLKCTFLEGGDVLVARMPDPLGRACIFPGDSKRAITVVDVCVVRPEPSHVDSRWLMHCLNSPATRGQIAGFASGTTRSRISRGNLGKVEICVPPVKEQRRIAAILDQAETLRAQRRAAMAQLNGLGQAVFLEMFGDPALLASGRRESLGSVTDFYAGNSLPESEAFSGQAEGAFLMKVSDMNLPGNERMISMCRAWSSARGAKAATCPAGSVVLPKRGGAIGTKKKRITTRSTILDPNLMAITPKEGVLHIEYLFQWFLCFDLSIDLL
jgi:hypothetical protein